MMKRKTKQKLAALIRYYRRQIRDLDRRARQSQQRAYGGIIRAGKGLLVESITKRLVEIAWEDLGGDGEQLSMERQNFKIPLKPPYLDRITSPEVRQFIQDHIGDYYYSLKTDVHVSINGQFKLAIECKAYTENAMLKRILVDFTLLRQVVPAAQFALVQLESQLGGDYSSLNLVKRGSPSTHTLLSYFEIDLNIITLLEGERKVDQPIHKPEHYKALRADSLRTALEAIRTLLHD